MSKHPLQKITTDEYGVKRFVENKIVSYLLDNGEINLNHIAVCGFSPEDHEQFAQLIGYSVSGFGSLSYASDDTIEQADIITEYGCEKEARIAMLEAKLEKMREYTRNLATEAFCIHPDDLTERGW